jgi:pectate lyase
MVAVAMLCLAHGTVLLDDTWADGTRTNTILPHESAWHASVASSLIAETNAMTGTFPPTSSRTWWTYFTTNATGPVSLAPGETLRVTLEFTPSGIAPLNAAHNLRLGLLNSSGGNRTTVDGGNPAGAGVSGYALFANFGATLTNNPLRIVERTNTGSANLIAGLGDYLVLGAGGGETGAPGFSNDAPYTLQLSARRNADHVVINGAFFDMNGWAISHSAADIAGMTTSFDTFVIFSPRANESATTFRFTRFKVEVLPDATATNAPSHAERIAVSNDVAEVSFSGEPGAPVEVQRSLDLTNWIGLLATNVPAIGSFVVTDDFADLGGAPAMAYYRLRGLIPIAPRIVIQPESQNAGVGQNVTLSAAAEGTEPLRYQWYFNGVPLNNATNAALSLTNVQLSNAGDYAVFVANDAGSAASDAASLNVFTAPAISMPPHDLIAREGQDITFSVVASGAEPLSYQWRFNTNSPIAGATNWNLTLANVGPGDAGGYSVVISNFVGSVTSAVATLIVNPADAAPDFSLEGFGRMHVHPTGGAGGAVVTVNNASDFTFYATRAEPYVVQVQGTIDFGSVSVRSGKTILGLGTNATLIGSLNLSGVTNIILRNLFITNPSGTGTGDGVTIINGSRHVWIDRCTFYDCADGACDVTVGSDYVTISWCKFYYTANTGHNFVNLIGADDSNTGDRGRLRITMHHNWWSTLCVERMPRVRFGQVHAYNNYYQSAGNNYCVRAAIESQVLLEKNHFHGVRSPYVKFITTGAPGRIKAAGNLFVNTTGTTDPGTDDVFTPPYSYALDPAVTIPNLVTNHAGAGRTAF